MDVNNGYTVIILPTKIWRAQTMDTNNPVIQLCIRGSQAEFAGRHAEAWALYEQAWGLATDDYEACIAAHYVARGQQNPMDVLFWNQESLRRADATGDERVGDFYPSLYLSLGKAYELSGDQAEAQHYYALAAGLGFAHQAE